MCICTSCDAFCYFTACECYLVIQMNCIAGLGFSYFSRLFHAAVVNFCLLMQRVKITGQVHFEQRSAVYHVQNALAPCSFP
jgi:hypothetical protein